MRDSYTTVSILVDADRNLLAYSRADNNSFFVNSNAVNPTRTWYGFVFSENALFHAMCSTVALCAWKYSGLDTKPDMLYHQGQTLRKINQWLHSMDTAPLDLLVATICTMTSFEVSNALHSSQNLRFVIRNSPKQYECSWNLTRCSLVRNTEEPFTIPDCLHRP